MKTLKLSTALASTILICALIASGCSQNPTDSQSGTGMKETAGSVSQDKPSKDKTILVNVFLQAGEKYVISASNFDQYGIDGFRAASLVISDPRVPVYQPDHCSDVEIFVEYDGKIVRGNCSASNFTASEVVLFNNSGTGLDVAATMLCYSHKQHNMTK